MNKRNFVKFLIIVFLLSFSLSSCWNKNENTTLVSSWVTIQEQTTTTENIIEKTEDTDDTQSISEKFFSNSAWEIKCTTTIEVGSGKIEQVVYISGNKMRMDSNWNQEWIPIENHMISDWEYNYIWWIGWSFKMKIEKNTENEIDSENENTKLDSWFQDSKEVLDNIPTSKCEKWEPDMQVFDLPEWIEFIDFGELQKSMKINIPNIPQ